MNEARRRSVLLDFAHAECANHVHAGTCEVRERAPCRLGRAERCPYFEASVLPIALRKLRLQQDPKHGGKPKDDSPVVDAYLREHPDLRGRRAGVSDAPARSCPDCGGPLPPGKRFCQTCRAIRRREADRRQKAKMRAPCPTVMAEKGGQNRLF